MRKDAESHECIDMSLAEKKKCLRLCFDVNVQEKEVEMMWFVKEGYLHCY